MGTTGVLGIAVFVLFVAVVALVLILRVFRARENAAKGQLAELKDVQARYQPIMDLEAAAAKLKRDNESVRHQLEEARRSGQAELQQLLQARDQLRTEVEGMTGEAEMQSFGLYEPRYDFEDSAEYKELLAEVRSEQKELVKDKVAAVCTVPWTVDGSAKKGERMVRDQLKMMLRAFNGDCDAAIAKVRYNNFDSIEKRIQKSFAQLNKLGATKSCEITDEYLELKLAELALFHEYQEKLQAEKEEQRRIREQMREEKRAQEELEKARKTAEAEEARYEAALLEAKRQVADATGKKHEKLEGKIAELERRLAEAHANKERAMSRAQMTRSGHVYVISNVGSFGDDVFKIGMTRRLDPMDRVKELGDASVPFPFDVHAMIYAEDAPALETKLHQLFTRRRVNLINERKEFFQVTLQEIAHAVRLNHGQIEFTLRAEAAEYRKTVARRNGGTPRTPSATATQSVARGVGPRSRA